MNYLYVILFFILSLNVEALTIKLNSAKEKNNYYSILHIDAKTPFKCSKKIISIKSFKYDCAIDKKSEISIKPKKSKFVDIYISSENNKTIISLYPKARAKAYSFDKPLYAKMVLDDTVSMASKHWIFIFYQKKIFLKTNNKNGINFPVDFLKELTPYIGALDPSGVPIGYINDSKDINTYLSIKDDYDKGRYEFAINEINKAIKNYPHSIFLNDFYLYKIRALKHLLQSGVENPNIEDLDYSTIIKLGKIWTKMFSSDPNIPEVLYYIATAYQSLGQDSDAEYFFDILITEHPKSKWTKLGIISFADRLFERNKQQKALKLYKDVLYSTDDMQVASIAADRLAEYYLKNKKPNLAAKFFNKILNANPKFFINNHQKAYDKAIALSQSKLNKTAIKLLELLLNDLKNEPDLKENIIKKLGDLYGKSGSKQNAIKYYKLYLKEFPYGQYTDSVKKEIDGMFFETDEKNSTKLLEHYDALIKKYNSGKIYQKANILKVKLLIKLKKYKKALKELDSFEANADYKKEVKNLKNRAATKLVKIYLKNSDCVKAIKLIDRYNLKIKDDTKRLAACYLETFDYKKVLNLSKLALKNSSLKEKQKLYWMDLEAKALLKMKKYDKLFSLSGDMITLSTAFNLDLYKKRALYYKFFALFNLKKYNKALLTAQKVEKNYKNEFKNIEIFQNIVEYAKNIDNSAMVVNYAKKIIVLQNRYKSYVLSPNIELTLIGALKKLGKFKDAIDIANNTLKRVNDKNIKARLLYEMGDISLKSSKKEKAKEYFRRCSKIDDTSWGELCKESLGLF